MRALIQRVLSASVAVGGEVVAAIGPGLLVLVGIAADDSDEDRAWMARKIVALRIFNDDSGMMNRGAPTLMVNVVPDSGTGELTGIAGRMQIIIEGKEHRYEIEYSLPA